MNPHDMDSDVEAVARELRGNWKRFGSFGWSGARRGDADTLAIVYLSNRDSGPLDLSNEAAILASLREADPMGRDHWTESHSHWAIGHVDCVVIRPIRRRRVTRAFRALHECMMALANYPVLDEADFCERETEEENETWSSFGARDFREWLASLSGCAHGADFFDPIPDAVLWTAWGDLSESCDRVIHESSGCYFPFRHARRVTWEDARIALLDAICEHTRRSVCCKRGPMTHYGAEGAHFVCCKCGKPGPWERGEPQLDSADESSVTRSLRGARASQPKGKKPWRFK